MASPREHKGSAKFVRKTQADSISQRTRNSVPSRLTSKNAREFDAHAFLATIGEGRRAILFPKKQTIFAQGEPSDAVFYLQTGKVRLTVVSKTGKEVTIGILDDGNFFGEGSLAGQNLRMGSATAMTDCAVLKIEKKAMLDTLHREHALSDLFVAYLLTRNIRSEEDLVDQLFNSSEKRLARALLMLANFGKERGVSRRRWSRIPMLALDGMTYTWPGSTSIPFFASSTGMLDALASKSDKIL
jgi:CRP/FNR family transcriptional regulator, cyclic AMP receptor protein